MSRCVICDSSDSGLSMYRPDGHFSAHKFHQMPGGDIYCDECYNADRDVTADFDLQDTMEDEENEEAFEYD